MGVSIFRCRAAWLLLALTSVMGRDGAAATYNDRALAVLQGLDKVTARVSTIEAALGEAVRFGTLEITVEVCRKRPPEEPPDSAAYLRIVDHRVDGRSIAAYQGWMFSSSPALAALDHPVYDIWVLDCRAREPENRADATKEAEPNTTGR